MRQWERTCSPQSLAPPSVGRSLWSAAGALRATAGPSVSSPPFFWCRTDGNGGKSRQSHHNTVNSLVWKWWVTGETARSNKPRSSRLHVPPPRRSANNHHQRLLHLKRLPSRSPCCYSLHPTPPPRRRGSDLRPLWWSTAAAAPVATGSWCSPCYVGAFLKADTGEAVNESYSAGDFGEYCGNPICCAVEGASGIRWQFTAERYYRNPPRLPESGVWWRKTPHSEEEAIVKERGDSGCGQWFVVSGSLSWRGTLVCVDTSVINNSLSVGGFWCASAAKLYMNGTRTIR